MSRFLWCPKEMRRLPAYRCLLCQELCPERSAEAESDAALEALLKSRQYKECFVVKRKGKAALEEVPAPSEKAGRTAETPGPGPALTPAAAAAAAAPEDAPEYFLLDNGKMQPFSPTDYTSTILYREVESFSVERRFVRPQDPDGVVYEGRKPSKKTVPMVRTASGESRLVDSWEELGAHPEQLVDAAEVLGVEQVKQVFVLRRK